MDPYFIIVVHMRGIFPEIMVDPVDLNPLHFDTREEAQAVANRIPLPAKYTIVQLVD